MEMVGTTSLGTKESILAGVFERLNVPSEEVESDSDVLAEEDEQDDEEDAPSGVSVNDIEDKVQWVMTTPTLSLHQGMYAPLVRLPPTLGPSKAPYAYEGYRRTSASISLEPEDPLLPLDTDEEALAVELRQEEELDAQDRIVAKKTENMLWGEYGRMGTRGTAMAEKVEEEFGNGLRFKAPGTDSHVKSQVYVVDSDSEPSQ
jgi:hypothetical protein